MARSPRDRRHIDQEATAEIVVISIGELSVKQKRLLTQIHGDLFGLTTECVSAEEYNKRQPANGTTSNTAPAPTTNPHVRYDFANITNPDNFLLREHIEDFKCKFGRQKLLTRAFVGRTYNYMVDGGSPVSGTCLGLDRSDPHSPRRIYRAPVPIPKIEVSSRAELGIPPYPAQLDEYGKSSMCGLYAVRAGSIVDANEAINGTVGVDRLKVPAAQYGLYIVASQLELQFVK